MFPHPLISTKEILGSWTEEDEKIVKQYPKAYIRTPLPGELEALLRVPSVQKVLVQRLQRWLDKGGGKTPTGLEIDDICLIVFKLKNGKPFRLPCLYPSAKRKSDPQISVVFFDRNGQCSPQGFFIEKAKEILDDKNPHAPLALHRFTGVAAPVGFDINPKDHATRADRLTACLDLFEGDLPRSKVVRTNAVNVPVAGYLDSIWEQYTGRLRTARHLAVMEDVDTNKVHCVVIDQSDEGKPPTINAVPYTEVLEVLGKRMTDPYFLVDPPPNLIRHAFDYNGSYYVADLELDDDTIIGLSGLHYNIFNDTNETKRYIQAIIEKPNFKKVAKECIRLSRQDLSVIDVTYKNGLIDHSKIEAVYLKDTFKPLDKETKDSKKIFEKPPTHCVRLFIHPAPKNNGVGEEFMPHTCTQDIQLPASYWDMEVQSKPQTAIDRDDLEWFRKNKGKFFRIRSEIPGEPIDGVFTPFFSSCVLVLYGIGGGRILRVKINEPVRDAIQNPWIHGDNRTTFTAEDLLKALRKVMPSSRNGVVELDALFGSTPNRYNEYLDWITKNPDERLLNYYQSVKAGEHYCGYQLEEVESTCYDQFVIASKKVAVSDPDIEDYLCAKNMASYACAVMLFSQWSRSVFPVYYPMKDAMEQALEPCLQPDDRLPIAIPHNAAFIDLRPYTAPFIDEELLPTKVRPLYLFCQRIRIDPLMRQNPIARLHDLKLSHITKEGIGPEDRIIINSACIHTDLRFGILYNDLHHDANSQQVPQPTQWTQWRVAANWLKERDERYVEGQMQALFSGLYYNIAIRPPRLQEASPRSETIKEAPTKLERLRTITLQKLTQFSLRQEPFVRPVLDPRGPLDKERNIPLLRKIREHPQGYYTGKGRKDHIIKVKPEKDAVRWTSVAKIMKEYFAREEVTGSNTPGNSDNDDE